MATKYSLANYLSTKSLLNGIEYVFAYDTKDLDSETKRNAIKKDIMSRPEWKDAAEIFKHLNKNKIFKAKYEEAFIFIIYCIIIGPDIERITSVNDVKGGSPNILLALVVDNPFNSIILSAIMICIFCMYMIVQDINHQLESMNIMVTPQSSTDALDKLMDSPEYTRYENNVLDYYNLTQEEQDEVSLMDYKINQLEKNLFPKKLNLFNAFLLGYGLHDIGEGMLQYINDDLAQRRHFLEQMTSEYLLDKGVEIVQEVIATRKPETLLEKAMFVVRGHEEVKRTIEDTGRSLEKRFKRSKNDFKHLLNNLEVEIEHNYHSARIGVTRKIDDYYHVLKVPCFIMYKLVAIYVGKIVYKKIRKSLEDGKKKRGRPKGSNSTKQRITQGGKTLQKT